MLLAALQTVAQPHVRPEDHFWRRRVVNRLVLSEKINKPLIAHEAAAYSPGGLFTETNGIVASLINGLKAGKYLAYDPDNWEKTLAYEDITRKMQEWDQALTGVNEETYAEDSLASDEWAASFDQPASEPVQDEWGLAPVQSDLPPPAAWQPDLMAYEEVIHMVEDWIFDKNTSSMVYQIAYFEVIWVDPSGALPEKVLARFMWKDVLEQLENTQWQNRFNDAEARSIAEAFELRIFDSFMISVGGNPIQTLAEAERRRQELIEFEHHLWNY
ncbi:MAG: hypothetical protein EAZ89_05580 [Bacteroidetes bacterium]|nr:MAG: hypothetical protein EAZ89_05580 [Bacteroidota bacterium]